MTDARRGSGRHREIPPARWDMARSTIRILRPWQSLLARGWLRSRGRKVRRRLLRHLAARGAGDRSPAAPRAGDRLGGARARRHAPDDAEGERDRRLPRRLDADYGGQAVASSAWTATVGPEPQRACVGAAGVHARAAGPGDDGRHGVLVVAGGDAPGVSGAAAGRVRGGARGRRDDDGRRRRCSSSSAGCEGMAPDGRCKSFSAAADGVGWARAAACWCSSGSSTRSATATACWR